MQQHQITLYNWSGVLRASEGHIKPEKGSQYTIQWVCTDWNPSMLSSENAGDINITKIYGEQVSIKKLNTPMSKNIMGVCQNTLGYMT